MTALYLCHLATGNEVYDQSCESSKSSVCIYQKTPFGSGKSTAEYMDPTLNLHITTSEDRIIVWAPETRHSAW